MTRRLTLVGITLRTSLPPLRPSESRTQFFVRPALASLCPPSAPKKTSHPWLNDRTIALVDAKRTAEWTPLEKEATLACSAGLAAAYHDYTARTAQKMRCIKLSSKLCWKKAKEIMKHEAQVSSIPALKSNDGEWVLDAQGKANLFAVTFAEKCKLPRLCCNTYTVCTQCHELQTSVVCPSVEQCMAVMTSLRDDSSTGPDLLPARILKRCAEQLAKPLQSLLQLISVTKSWPQFLRHSPHCTIVEGCRATNASIDRASHQSHSCFWTKQVCAHQMSRSTRCWPISRCHGSLRSTDARKSRSTVWMFRERSTEFELSVYWRNSDAKEYTPRWSR